MITFVQSAYDRFCAFFRVRRRGYANVREMHDTEAALDYLRMRALNSLR
jgi:hypothetical protein